MRQTFQASRRKALQLFASAPLLPLSGALGSSSLLLSACGGSDSVAAPVVPATATSVKFNGMAAPATVAERAAAYTAATIDIGYSDGSKKTAQALAYQALYRTGDVLSSPTGGSFVAGGYYYPDGVTPMIDTSGATFKQFVSDCPDGTSLIKLASPTVPGISGNTVFLVTQFEYKSVNAAGTSMYGVLPSPVGIATLSQDKTTGALTAQHYFNVPTDSVHGLWITCAGSLSPWNTHLSSEEYEPDAWKLAPANLQSFIDAKDKDVLQFRSFSLNTFGSETAANPYHYGHVPEVTVHADGTGSIKKHYGMGRISRELVQVMPDQRTVLMGDDATSGGMFMFVADVAGNLASGTLYAAKLTQTSADDAADGGAFTLGWIKLGQANSVEIKAMADTCKASDIIDVRTTDPLDATFTRINFGNGVQWVKVKAGMEKAAAFLETRRYAALMGATLEMTKYEGVSVNVKDKKAYLGVSAIRDTMETAKPANFAKDDIRLKKIAAGATYEAVLGTDAAIGSDWVPKSMMVPTALLGKDMAKDADGNTADVNSIANTDNVKYSEAMRTLFIGEDSGAHLNNFVWAYNVDTKEKARLLSVPAGAECVCLTSVDDMNGFAYVFSGFQHAGDWAFTSPAQDDLKAAVKANWGLMEHSAVGYISGIPKLG